MAREDITMVDMLNLQSIKKKLKVGMKDLNRAQKAKMEYDSEDEWMRNFLRIPNDMDVPTYLASRLNEKELETLRKLLKEGIL